MNQPGVMTQPSRFHNWLSLARISNLSTVWTNLLVGSVLGWIIRALNDIKSPQPSFTQTLVEAWPLLPGVSLLYIAGMILNDLCDVKIDRDERPERPLPSGRIRTRTAMTVTVILIVIGAGLIAWGGWLAAVLGLALLGSIIGYDLIHKRTVWAVLLMGLCRMWVYLLPVVWVAGPDTFSPTLVIAWPVVLAMGLYTVLITVIARGEASQRPWQKRGSHLLSWAMLVIPIGLSGLYLIWIVSPVYPILVGVLLIVVMAWLVRAIALLRGKPAKIGPAVETYLAGFCLVDALLLAIFELPYAAGLAIVLFFLTLLGHRFIKGT